MPRPVIDHYETNEYYTIKVTKPSLRYIDFFLSERFYLGAGERNTGLEIFDDFVIETCLTIDSDLHLR